MYCLQNLSISSSLLLRSFKCRQRNPEFRLCKLVVRNFTDLHRRSFVKAVSGSTSSAEMSGADVDDAETKEEKVEEEEEKSEIYSHNMTEAMGTVLTYRHELGMNYNFIRPDLIVGSCLQTPEDVDKLRSIGVKTIFCLQQDPDLEYFGVDIGAIIAYTKTFDDIEHLRAQIRDFDAFDLRLRLPAVVSKLHKAINQNGGVAYIHCTAGLGRAPAVAMAYMFWVQGYELNEALELLLRKRSCFPKIDAIKNATADILSGFKKKPITLSWEDDQCSTVEVSGLDIGWGQLLLRRETWLQAGLPPFMQPKHRIPLKFDKERGAWILNRELADGRYEYKYIIDGVWTCNENAPVTTPNKDGHVNNFIEVVDDDDPRSERAILRGRLTGDDPELTNQERGKIRQFLEASPDEN